MLQWSFVRDDQPRATACWQIAMALRDDLSPLAEHPCCASLPKIIGGSHRINEMIG